MALTIAEILRAVNPNIGLVVNPDGSYRIGVEDVNSDEILASLLASGVDLAAIEVIITAINTALQAGGITQTQLAAMVTALQTLDNIVSGNEAQVDVLSIVGLSGLQIIPINLFEWTSSTWIATQALTVDGVQLSDEKTQVVGGAKTQVFGAIFEPPKAGTLVAVQLGLTCQLKSGEATAAKTWGWEARNKAGTWVALHTAVSENLTTAYVEKYRSGVFYAVANFNAVPFEIGLFCTPHASTASATIISQVKSSCWAIVSYKPS